MLSGVGNRNGFDKTLQYWLTKLKRNEEHFALALIDIDRFKWINDTHGHVAGDRVVANVGRFLRETAGEGDYVARFGGDEFVLLSRHAEPGEAVEMAEQLRKDAERRNFDVHTNDKRVAVTFSIGVAIARPDDDAPSLVERADQALYKSKQAGRNCVHVYEAVALAEPARLELVD
jgi:diguanylate cyclase (GGDEF)-like protein